MASVLFLTDAQQALLSRLQPALKEQVENRLLASRDFDSITCGQLILEIYKYPCAEDLGQTLDLYFLEILNVETSARLDVLNKLIFICRKNGSTGFFRCISTQKIQFHSKGLLIKIVKIFHAVAEANPDLSSLSDFPSYEEGGKDWLMQLQRNPSLTAFSYGKGSSVVSNLQSNDQLNQILSQSSSFVDLKLLAIRYLTSLPDAHRSSMEIYIRIFRSLQNDSQFFQLPDVCKTILIKLILLLTTDENQVVPQKFSSGDLDEMLEEMVVSYEKWGEEFLILFSDALNCENDYSLDGVIRSLKLCNLLAQDSHSLDRIHRSLLSFSTNAISLADFITSLEELVQENSVDIQNDRIEDLQVLNRRMRGEDPHVRFPLPSEKMLIVERQYLVVEYYCDKFKTLRLGQLVEMASETRAKGVRRGFQEDDIIQLIAIGRIAAYIKFQIYPRNTQIYTVLAQLSHDKGAMAQVKTGEGKTLIVTLLSFVLAMQNKSVHIISSDRVLATRDQKKAVCFFEPFSITTSNICADDAEQERFKAQILYGTATDFEFAIMREQLYFTSLFEQPAPSHGDSRFDCVIIDELDNLILDTAQNSARLSFPMEETFDWVYLPIFTFMKENFEEEDSAKLESRRSLIQLREVLESYTGGHFKEQVSRFDDRQLSIWLQSAFHAYHQLNVGEDYVVLATSRRGKKEKEVVIVDANNTGRLIWGSRWSGGIHEFVEVKEQLTPRRESLCPITLSHPVYYGMYNALYGLTGTLGDDADRDEIYETYGSASFDIPTFRPCRRVDIPPVIVSQDKFYSEIQAKVTRVREEGRPALVVCRTIKESERTAREVDEANIPNKLLNEIQVETEEAILELAGEPGAVTIATNTAGRGTDIILKGKSEKNGGGHVLINFYPKSKRVEDQVRGRVGRQGQIGSSEILICRESLGDIPEDLTTKEILSHLEEQRVLEARLMKQMRQMQAKVEKHVYNHVRHFFMRLSHFDALIHNQNFLQKLSRALSSRKLLRRGGNVTEGLAPISHQISDNSHTLSPHLVPLQGRSVSHEHSPCPAGNQSVATGERFVQGSGEKWGLDYKDKLLIEEAFILLTNKQLDLVRWSALLQQIGKRLKSKILNNWSLLFYQKVDELLNEARRESIRNINCQLESTKIAHWMKNRHNPLAPLFEMVGEALIEEEKDRIQGIERAIDTLLEQKRDSWEKYLDPSGSGLVCYLRENLKTPLIGIETVLFNE